MADGTGVEVEILTPAVQAELHRIIRDGDQAVRASYAARMRPYLFRIIREVHPWLTRDMWTEIAGVDAPVIDETREQERRRRDREVGDARALLQQHGRPTCCPDCDVQNAATLRRELGNAAQAPVQVVDEDAPQERTCACDACDDDRCQGDCDQCDDHGCEQCYGGHTVYDCCGYCEDCDRHPDNADSPNYHRCGECDHCSECEHYCR